MDANMSGNHADLSTERRRRQRGKNIAVLVSLLALVALLYVITVVRMGGS